MIRGLFSKLRDRKSWKIYKQLKELESASVAEIKVRQSEKVHALLLYAFKNVPYYRALFKREGFDPVNYTNLQDLQSIPVLTKQIVKKEKENLVSNEYSLKDLRKNASGGSTGDPVTIYQTSEYFNVGKAARMLFDSWSGYRQGQPMVKLWGSERDIIKGSESNRTKLSNWLRNMLFLNSFKMTESDMMAYVEKLNTFQPVQIMAYVESAYDFARYILKNDIEVHSPKAVMVSAGTLTPAMRETIEEAFNCDVFNRYGSREVGGVACEHVDHDGLYIPPLIQYVEVVGEDGKPAEPGDEGEILITNFTNYGMPLIRYKIGDRGICKKRGGAYLNWPGLEAVMGRSSDTFINSKGDKISGIYLLHFIGVVHNNNSIKKFQVIQKQINEVLVKVVIEDHSGFLSIKEDIINSIKKVMGKECKVHFEEVEEIAASNSGKFRYIKSEITA